MSEPARSQSGGGQIAQLALPALGVLTAELLYLLLETAILGRRRALSGRWLVVGN